MRKQADNALIHLRLINAQKRTVFRIIPPFHLQHSTNTDQENTDKPKENHSETLMGPARYLHRPDF
jgi:hypothetical protein